MKLRKFFLLFFAVFLLIGLFYWGISSLFLKMFITIHDDIPSSPLENDVLIGNTFVCSDSDGGIFFYENGRISFERKFLIWKWRTHVSDECDENELIEYYCSGDSLVGARIDCENGCADGRCVE